MAPGLFCLPPFDQPAPFILPPSVRISKITNVPHLVLEISNNVQQRPSRDFYQKLHSLAVEYAPFELCDLKSRLIVHDSYFVGNGDDSNAFIHLGISMLAGRDQSIRKRLSSALLDFLKTEFTSSISSLNCRVTVEIREIDRETHSKST